jgi:hypothetical protein
VVSRVPNYICATADVIRNNLWVSETTRLRRSTAQLMQVLTSIVAITSIPALPALRSPWEIIHENSLFIGKMSLLTS